MHTLCLRTCVEHAAVPYSSYCLGRETARGTVSTMSSSRTAQSSVGFGSSALPQAPVVSVVRCCCLVPRLWIGFVNETRAALLHLAVFFIRFPMFEELPPSPPLLQQPAFSELGSTLPYRHAHPPHSGHPPCSWSPCTPVGHLSPVLT